MITASLINSAATLNDFQPLASMNFVPGENLTVNIQISDPQKGIRYIPNSAATLTMTFMNVDSTQTVVNGSLIDANDRSLWTCALTQTQTENLGAQNIIVTLDELGDGTIIRKCLIQNVLIRTNLSGDC